MRDIARFVPAGNIEYGTRGNYIGAYSWTPRTLQETASHFVEAVTFPFSVMLAALNSPAVGGGVENLERFGDYMEIPADFTDFESDNALDVSAQVTDIQTGDFVNIRYQSLQDDDVEQVIELRCEIGNLGFLRLQSSGREFFRFYGLNWSIVEAVNYDRTAFTNRWITYKLNDAPFPFVRLDNREPFDFWVDIVAQSQAEGLIVGLADAVPLESIDFMARYTPDIDARGSLVYQGQSYNIAGLSRTGDRDMVISCQRELP